MPVTAALPCSAMFFEKKVNQGVSEEKYRQLKYMSYSYFVYASKIHRKRIKNKIG